MPPFRIAIVGASSLRGKELATALRERRFPALPPRLLQPPAAPGAAARDQRALIAFDEEAAVAEELSREALEDLDALFLAGSPADALAAWKLAEPLRLLVVDLTSGLEAVPGAALAGLEPSPADTRLAVVAHPAAQALALLLDRLARAGRVELAAATVFEPASERDLDGLRELEQQAVRLLAVQPLPQRVYDAQVAFNLRAALGPAAAPSLAALRARIARQLGRLRADDDAWPLPALELLQAPLFHATVISLFVRFAAPLPSAALPAALQSPWLANSADFPDVIAAAGEDAIQLGPLRPDPAVAGGFWLFATLDNLRRCAFSAVDAAQTLLAGRSA
ncbi:MAG TPA: hypothetical protein VMV31_06065 [Terriglobales bacterium]|nr:hypothetical protein [Terriglobales bacterium]